MVWGYLLMIAHYWANEIPTLFQLIRSLWNKEPIDLKKRYGSWAVITGSSDGIGKAYAKQLAARGINIVLVGRNKEKLQAVASEIESKSNVQTKLIIADFKNGREIYEGIREQLEDIDVGILVNNVGVQYHHPMSIAELPDDEVWDNVHINVTSTVMMAKLVLPKLIAKNQGAIINISSAAGYQGMPYMNLYAASKSYVTSFSEALREEVGHTKITVQTLTPYYISSAINHFEKRLQKVSLVIPDVDTYVASALGCLGIVNTTTGYWPHRVVYTLLLLTPAFLRTKSMLYTYRKIGSDFKKRAATSK